MDDLEEILARPELVLGPNPLIEALPPFLTPRDMAKAMSRYPLDGRSWRNLPPQYREPLLECASEHYGPTAIALPIGAAIQALIRRAMVQRNPLRKDEQRRTNVIGVATSQETITRQPKLDAGGALLGGMTGMGKTSIVRRTLDLVAPQQVIEHGPSQVCGWTHMRQVVWLYVDHPSNGSRGALLKRILMSLDEVAGTCYSDQYKNVSNIDSLLTVVSKLMTVHRVALLIVDEKQVRNFQDSPWAIEFVLFYLNLMNLGIATLLIGNPMAFEHLQSFSQVLRRFSTAGIHLLKPAKHESERWWRDDLCPRIRRFSVMDSCGIDPTARARFEFEHTAGIPGLLQLLNIESQRVALRRSAGSTVELTIDDCHGALKNSSFSGVAEIARQVHLQDPVARDMIDIPSNDPAPGRKVSQFKLPDSITIETLQRLTHRYQAFQTRELGKFKKKLQSVSELTPEQIQMLGMTSELVAAAEAAQAEIEGLSHARKGVSKNSSMDGAS